MLDPIHNKGLRLALEAFRTSPVASLYVEADEPSLYSFIYDMTIHREDHVQHLITTEGYSDDYT